MRIIIYCIVNRNRKNDSVLCTLLQGIVCQVQSRIFKYFWGKNKFVQFGWSYVGEGCNCQLFCFSSKATYFYPRVVVVSYALKKTTKIFQITPSFKSMKCMLPGTSCCRPRCTPPWWLRRSGLRCATTVWNGGVSWRRQSSRRRIRSGGAVDVRCGKYSRETLGLRISQLLVITKERPHEIELSVPFFNEMFWMDNKNTMYPWQCLFSRYVRISATLLS